MEPHPLRMRLVVAVGYSSNSQSNNDVGDTSTGPTPTGSFLGSTKY